VGKLLNFFNKPFHHGFICHSHPVTQHISLRVYTNEYVPGSGASGTNRLPVVRRIRVRPSPQTAFRDPGFYLLQSSWLSQFKNMLT
jgi:hypothetical protein